MASLTGRNGTAEIVSPAGNLEKLKMAVLYGADAVYFGGDNFNLRVRAGNFNREDLNEGIRFAKDRGVKTIFLLNSYLHEHNLPEVEAYLRDIKQLDIDAVMISDPGMAMMVQDAGIEAQMHLSTQMSTLNHQAVNFWHRAGFTRIVMGRETTLEEIRVIRDHTDAELEIFAHGALCIAYSGRCLLSRYLTGRDANQGDCAQSCRWNFTLVEKKRPGNYMDIVEHGSGTEIISSKDLKLVQHMEAYLDAGVDAFKIEGRMKSLYHAAQTTRIYKHALQLAGTDAFDEYLPFWEEELDLVNHRPYTDDLFNEYKNGEFTGTPYIKRAIFMGYLQDNGTIKTFNPIKLDEELEAIYPIGEKVIDHPTRPTEIVSPDNQKVDMARPGGEYMITFDPPLKENAILRKKTGTQGADHD